MSDSQKTMKGTEMVIESERRHWECCTYARYAQTWEESSEGWQERGVRNDVMRESKIFRRQKSDEHRQMGDNEKSSSQQGIKTTKTGHLEERKVKSKRQRETEEIHPSRNLYTKEN